jgi:SMC interacting uncharacterized protein involved in chromosome segregation
MQTMQKMQQNIYNLTLHVKEKGEDFERLTEKMQGEIDGLKQDKRVLIGRLGKLESDLKGSQETVRATQGALQQVKQENAHLQQLVEESSAQNAQLAAELGITQREQGLLKKSVKRQTAQLKTSVQKTALQEQLQGKQAEKAKLEGELSTIRGNLQKQKDKITIPTAVVAGGALGFFTGGFGWVLAGFAAGVAGASAAANSPICPCVTKLHAELSSAQARLDLVNQEIGDLEAKLGLNPSNGG